MHTSTFFALLATLATGAGLVAATGPRPECTETYRPQPTDTCASISADFGISVSQIESLNPGISCNAPINFATVCLQSFTPKCTLDVPATSTTCTSLAAQYDLTVAQFVQLNDNVDAACDDLVVGQQYCVSTADCFPGNTNPCCLPNNSC